MQLISVLMLSLSPEAMAMAAPASQPGFEKTLMWKQRPRLDLTKTRVVRTGDVRGIDDYPRNQLWLHFPNHRHEDSSFTPNWNTSRYSRVRLPSKKADKKKYIVGGPNFRDSFVLAKGRALTVYNNPESMIQAVPFDPEKCKPYDCEDLYREYNDHQSLGMDVIFNPPLRPWAEQQNSIEALFKMTIPKGKADAGVNYVNLAYIIQERYTGFRFWFLVQIFDSRGFKGQDGPRLSPQYGRMDLERRGNDPKLQVTNDCQHIPNPDPTDQCHKPIIFTALTDGMRYITKAPDSMEMTGMPFERWKKVKFEITREQMVLMISDLNANPSLHLPQLSSNPTDWQVLGASLHNETAVLRPLLSEEAKEDLGKKNPELYLSMSMQRMSFWHKKPVAGQNAVAAKPVVIRRTR